MLIFRNCQTSLSTSIRLLFLFGFFFLFFLIYSEAIAKYDVCHSVFVSRRNVSEIKRSPMFHAEINMREVYWKIFYNYSDKLVFF